MKISKEEKSLAKIKKHKDSKYIPKGIMRSRMKNSRVMSNVKEVGEDGLIYLKTGEVSSLIEIKAIDLSLTSNQEKNNFFVTLKALYQIRGINLKCYKIDDRLNLNNNKVNLDSKLEYFESNEKKKALLEESKNLIEYLEENDFTVSSKYFFVLTAKTQEELEKILDEVEEVLNDISPKINHEIIQNKLEIYKFLTNVYLTNTTLDQLVWSDLPEMVAPMNLNLV